jgi:hypothetical protein
MEFKDSDDINEREMAIEILNAMGLILSLCIATMALFCF